MHHANQNFRSIAFFLRSTWLKRSNWHMLVPTQIHTRRAGAWNMSPTRQWDGLQSWVGGCLLTGWRSTAPEWTNNCSRYTPTSSKHQTSSSLIHYFCLFMVLAMMSDFVVYKRTKQNKKTVTGRQLQMKLHVARNTSSHLKWTLYVSNWKISLAVNEAALKEAGLATK